MEESLFCHLYKEHYEALCRYAYKITRDVQVAEDLVENLFTVLWEKKSLANYPSRSYLFSAIYYASLNWLRHTKTVEKFIADRFVDYMEEGLLLQPSDEEKLYVEELNERMDVALKNLPQKCREIFELSRIRGLKNREIAEYLHISENTVEKQISIALKRLRMAIREWMSIYL